MSDNPIIELKTLFSIGFPLAIAYVGKIVWAYFMEGRVERAPIYTSISTCQQNRDSCNLGCLKDKITSIQSNFETFKAETQLQQKETDKRLSETADDLRALKEDITEIKAGQARTNALLEILVEQAKNGKVFN